MTILDEVSVLPEDYYPKGYYHSDQHAFNEAALYGQRAIQKYFYDQLEISLKGGKIEFIQNTARVKEIFRHRWTGALAILYEYNRRKSNMKNILFSYSNGYILPKNMENTTSLVVTLNSITDYSGNLSLMNLSILKAVNASRMQHHMTTGKIVFPPFIDVKHDGLALPIIAKSYFVSKPGKAIKIVIECKPGNILTDGGSPEEGWTGKTAFAITLVNREFLGEGKKELYDAIRKDLPTGELGVTCDRLLCGSSEDWCKPKTFIAMGVAVPEKAKKMIAAMCKKHNLHCTKMDDLHVTCMIQERMVSSEKAEYYMKQFLKDEQCANLYKNLIL